MTGPEVRWGCRRNLRCRRLYVWLARSQKVVECSAKLVQQIALMIGSGAAIVFVLRHFDEAALLLQAVFGKAP